MFSFRKKKKKKSVDCEQIKHDLKNYLNGINGYITLSQMDKKDKYLKHALSDINEMIEYMDKNLK